MNVKRAFIVLCALSLSACSGGRSDLRREADRQADRIRQLEQRAAALEARNVQLEQQVQHLQKEATRQAYEWRKDLERETAALSGRIAELQRPGREAPPAPAPIPPARASQSPDTRIEPPGPKFSVFSATPAALADFIQPPPGPNPDLFPLRVFEVRGRKVVTGSHTSVRYVETGEVYRDSFSDKQKKVEPREEKVDEYGYQAAFSAENLTRTDKTIEVSAGGPAKTFVIAAGATATNLSVDSSMGAELSVAAGGMNRRFPVAY